MTRQQCFSLIFRSFKWCPSSRPVGGLSLDSLPKRPGTWGPHCPKTCNLLPHILWRLSWQCSHSWRVGLETGSTVFTVLEMQYLKFANWFYIQIKLLLILITLVIQYSLNCCIIFNSLTFTQYNDQFDAFSNATLFRRRSWFKLSYVERPSLLAEG